MNLNVNIDHVATLRQARGESGPSPVKAALAAEKAGGAGIVAHLREDRRHIQDNDIYELRKAIKTKLNMEMAATDEMVKITLSVLPDMATIVPEKREELTTEGGLDVSGNQSRVKEVISELSEKKIMVSLFVEPDFDQIKTAADIGADMVEIHTGKWACANGIQKENELRAIEKAVFLARDCDLRVSAGHGLDYENVNSIAKIEGVEELNIGYGIIARAVFDGIEKAVRDMIKKINAV
ncbi:MAG: pyridoxine 5'-phosphate synthase [Candidatus Mycalebacterium zealandia]|nr:MAG: pyridoxine 5'-phosphate synthase [Candidatus Mycalebacterium zealandia]